MLRSNNIAIEFACSGQLAMRVEFALIAAILVFCFWCAFILFNIETSFTMSSPQTISGYNSSSSTSFYNIKPQKLQYQRDQQQYHNYRQPYITQYKQQQQQQQQYNQQQATKNMPFWETKIEPELDSQLNPNNRTSFSQNFFRFPQARMRSNNTAFPLTYLEANLSNSYRKPNKDYSSVSASHYNSTLPGFQVDYYQTTRGRQPERVGMLDHKTVGLSSWIVPKETNSLSNSFESNSKLNSESDKSKSGLNEPVDVNADTEEEEESGGDEEETSSGVNPEFKGKNNNNNKFKGGGINDSQQQQEKQAAEKEEQEEEQEGIRRRSWQEDQVETKTGSNKSVKKINPANRNKQQSSDSEAQILSHNLDSERIIPSGRGAGSKLQKKTPFNGDKKQFRQNLGRIIRSNNKKILAEEIEDGFASQKLTKAIGKSRANVARQNAGNQKESIGKKLIKLSHPNRQIGMSTASKKSPKKVYNNHRVRETLTAQHWDDDASSPIGSRTKKPSTHSDNEPEADDKDGNDSGNDEEEEEEEEDADREDLNPPYDLNKDEAKEEMEAEAETGPQQVAPELSELDLVEDPEQFMHASDRRKRDVLSDGETKTTFSDIIMLSICKDSPPIRDSSKSVRDFDIIERLGWIR